MLTILKYIMGSSGLLGRNERVWPGYVMGMGRGSIRWVSNLSIPKNYIDS